MAEESEHQSLPAPKELNKTVLFATLFVKRVTMESVLSAGKAALLALLILVLIASSPHLMEEEVATLSGTRVNANSKTPKDVKRTELFTIPNAQLVSTMLP